MSKEAALRAMREARYAEQTARTATATRPVRAATRPPVAPPVQKAAPSTPVGHALCGHRSMNGRTCTREQGHSAKSHRYS